MTAHKKNSSTVLFLIRKSPYGTSHIKEAIDAILAALTIDLAVSVIFLDDGVWQIKSDQNPQTIHEKNYTATFKALPLYGSINIFVEKESLLERGLTSHDLLMTVTELDRNKIAQLFTEQDILITI